ncbi:6-phospho-3-hexuloisomerase [Candidatus Poribacteria bacterium]|nr:6-phospho-3-hexuloisomerase [Candidatus Poribacteria bacterium]
MNFPKITNSIIKEIKSSLNQVSEDRCIDLVKSITSSERVYLTGMGRSGLVARAFAMRLTHVGLTVHVVGDVTTPAIDENDLLVVISGSGRTDVSRHIAYKAKSAGAEVFLITSQNDSEIGNLADSVLVIPVIIESVQPLGSPFEDAAYIFLETLVIMIMKTLDVTQNDMMLRHSNLE